jgi:crotonobetainyl-CoA:carnitine CoA-transferase CaiB-like acyl-CoA transferase
VAVAAANDGLFGRLCKAIGRLDLGSDERYATNEARVRNRAVLIAELEPVFLERSSEDWLSELLAAGVPAGKIRTVGDALRAAADAGLPATARVTHPTAGSIELVNAPFSFAGAPVGTADAPPLLGQHTAEVLAEIGVDEERLAALEERGVIVRAGAA